MKFLKNAGSAIVVIALLVGWRFYNKSSDADDVKTVLLEVCEGDEACVNAVNTNFTTCFDKSYDMGGRHRSASLDATQLTDCINQESGVEYFAYAE